MSEEQRQDDTRRREDAAVRMEQRLEDFLKVYDADKLESREWRAFHDAAHQKADTKLERRLKPIEDLVKTLTTPAKIIGTTLLLMATPILGVVGWGMLRWLGEQVQDAVSHGRPWRP